jgi:hypothetical protein
MFSYGEAETLLASLHEVPPEHQHLAFRARLKHLKKLGIPLGSSPGKGKKVRYTSEQIYQWAFCLQLEELGISPSAIVSLLREQWCDRIRHLIAKAGNDSENHYCVIVPSFMSDAWKTGAGQFPEVVVLPARLIVPFLTQLGIGRMALFNVSAIVRNVSRAAQSNRGGTSTNASAATEAQDES